jgi:hypothetical protein
MQNKDGFFINGASGVDNNADDFMSKMDADIAKFRPPRSSNLDGYLKNYNIRTSETPSTKNLSLSDYGKAFQANLANDRSIVDPMKMVKPHMGDFRNPNLPNQYWDRYAAYGSDFKKLGTFDPTRDNESFYNAHTNGWDDFQRAFGQWSSLAGTMFVDAMSFGSDVDTKTASQIERNFAIGSSSRKGVSGFATNTFLSSGFTIGILAEMAAEELAMAGLEAGLIAATPFTGGVSAIGAGAVGARMAAKATSTFMKLNKGLKTISNIRNQIDNLQDINKVRKMFNTVGGRAAKFLNPLEHTTDFVKTVDKMDDVSNTVKVTRGVASFYKDIRAVRAAYGESALEAGSVENEMKQTMMDEFYSKTGRYPNQEEAKSLTMNAKLAGHATFVQNMPLILLSNKITFGELNRGPFKRLYADVGKGLQGEYISSVGKNGIRTFTALPKNFLARQATMLKNPKVLLGNAMRYSTENVTEGLQEVGQEIITGLNKDYYTDQYKGNLDRGGYYNYLTTNMDKQLSMQGLETFASGALMQMFVKPVTSFAGALTRGKKGMRDSVAGQIGGAINEAIIEPIQYAKRPDAYQKHKAQKLEQSLNGKQALEDELTMLTDFFKDPMKYLSPQLSNAVEQGKLLQAMDAAEKSGDKKAFMDFKDNSTFKHITTALNSGYFDSVIDHLKDLKQLSADEIKADYNQPYEQYIGAIDMTLKKAANIQKRWEYAQQTLPNPINLQGVDTTSPLGIKKAIQHKAWNEAVNELVFNQYSFDEAVARKESILSKLKSNIGLEKADYNSVNLLLNTTSRVAEISKLKSELEALGQFSQTTADMKKLVSDKTSRLAKLEKLNDVLTEAIDNTNTDTELTDAQYNSLHKAYAEYINNLSEESDDLVSSQKITDSLQDILDYNSLDARSKQLNKHLDTLANPKAFQELAQEMNDMLTVVYENKNVEIEKSLSLFKEKAIKDEMLKELNDAQLFMDVDQIEALKEDNKMPLQIYSSKKINGEYPLISYRSAEYKEAIAIIKEYHPELRDIPIYENIVDNVYSGKARNKTKNAKVSDTRTYAMLAAEYGFDPDATQSEVGIRKVLEQVLNSELTSRSEKMLAEDYMMRLTDDETITFVNNSSKPFNFNSESTTPLTIDARYSAEDFNNDGLPFEVLILKAVTARLVLPELENDADFNKDVTRLMTLAKEEFDKLSPDEKATHGLQDKLFLGLSSPENFAVEALTNLRFQRFLGTIQTDYQDKKNSIWYIFIDAVLANISKILGGANVNGTLLNEALNIVTARVKDVNEKIERPDSTKQDIAENDVVTKELNPATVSITELQQHPDLTNELITLFKQKNQEKIDADDTPLLENIDALDTASILESDGFKSFLRNPDYMSKERLFITYNEKLNPNKKEEPAQNITTSGKIGVIQQQPVTDAEFKQFTDKGIVSQERIVMLALKLKNNIPYNDQERAMYAEVSDNVESITRKLAEQPSEIITTDMRTELKNLGFKNIRNVAQAHEILALGLTIEQRRALEQDPSTNERDALQIKLRNEVFDKIDNAESPNALDDVKADIIQMLLSNPQYSTVGKITSEEIEKRIQKRLDELAKDVNFVDIQVGEKVQLNNSKKEFVKVIKKTDTQLTVISMNGKTQQTINKDNVESTIKFRNNAAIKAGGRLVDTPEITDADKEMFKKSTATAKEILENPDTLKADLEAAKASTEEDLFNDLNNKICK